MAAFAAPSSPQGPERTFSVAGYVLDAGSRRPVPGVLVEDESWAGKIIQAQTDLNGHFVLQLTLVKGRGKVRRLLVHTVLYEGEIEVTATGNKEQQVVILLRRNAYRFKPYGCQQLGDSVSIAPYAPTPIKGLPGIQYAFLIRDSTIQQPRKLKTLTFKVNHNSIPREVFQVHIYECNGLDKPPGDYLLHGTFNICPGKEDGIFTYDVSAYEIMISKSGFFLALKGDEGGTKWICYDPMPNYTPTGSIMRPPCARADIRTWESAIGKGWQRATAVENCWPLYESALSVEVEPAPRQPTKH
ncbi:hypothetical protein [Hymenobacter glaciei]